MKSLCASALLVLVSVTCAIGQGYDRSGFEAAEKFLKSEEGQREQNRALREMDAIAEQREREARERYGAGSAGHETAKGQLCAKGYSQYCD
jgi:hypothetical protein